MHKKILLIFGLPGAGKTTFSEMLRPHLDSCIYYNADEVRRIYNDWDFSIEGRVRQAVRMSQLANESAAKFVICDFVCPLKSSRILVPRHWAVFLNTIKVSRFHDTNQLFEWPDQSEYNLEINAFDKFDEAVQSTLKAITS